MYDGEEGKSLFSSHPVYLFYLSIYLWQLDTRRGKSVPSNIVFSRWTEVPVKSRIRHKYCTAYFLSMGAVGLILLTSHPIEINYIWKTRNRCLTAETFILAWV